MQTAVLTDKGEPAGVGEDGHLVITDPWPGMIRGTWGDEDGKRFKDVYFSMFKGYFTTGDGAAIDADGDYWLMGRIDDVLNVSGHRIGTAEVESALVSHPKVAEAAVVGYPHPIKGTGIYAYVVLNDGVEPNDDLKKALVVHVRKVVGPIATPDKMQFAATGLPKTRSGKIMRRILRKIAEGEFDALGDTSTLADPAVVDDLKANTPVGGLTETTLEEGGGQMAARLFFFRRTRRAAPGARSRRSGTGGRRRRRSRRTGRDDRWSPCCPDVAITPAWGSGRSRYRPATLELSAWVTTTVNPAPVSCDSALACELPATSGHGDRGRRRRACPRPSRSTAEPLSAFLPPPETCSRPCRPGPCRSAPA